MSNLIITIISIALVAITALLGIYYGGPAFSNYSLKAKAQQIFSDEQQIASALQLWQADNNGISGNGTISGADVKYSPLYPKYLANVPAPPVEFANIGNPYYSILYNGPPDASSRVVLVALYFQVTSQSQIDICMQAAKIGMNDANASSGLSAYGSSGAYGTRVLNGSRTKFDCVANGAVGAPVIGNYMSISYLVGNW